jgi:hypothetical protein
LRAFNLSFLIVWFFIEAVQAHLNLPSSVEFACTKCHTNTLGGSNLNFFGKSFLSTQMNAQWFPKISPNDLSLSDESWWINPQARFSIMAQRRNPNGTDDKAKTFLKRLELSASSTANLSPVGFSVTWGHLPSSLTVGTQSFDPDLIEYYLRYEGTASSWIYIGLLPKAFGLRISDHSALHRSFLGFSPYGSTGYESTQQVLFHKQNLESNFAIGFFQGHPKESPQLRQKGGSVFLENTITESFKLGTSAMVSKNELERKELFALHSRYRLSPSAVVLFEQGWIFDKSLLAEIDSNYYKRTGNYTFFSLSSVLSAGIFWINQMSRITTDNNGTVPELWRFSTGLDAYLDPNASVQIRASNDRSLNKERAFNETWSVYSIFNFYF